MSNDFWGEQGREGYMYALGQKSAEGDEWLSQGAEEEKLTLWEDMGDEDMIAFAHGCLSLFGREEG